MRHLSSSVLSVACWTPTRSIRWLWCSVHRKPSRTRNQPPATLEMKDVKRTVALCSCRDRVQRPLNRCFKWEWFDNNDWIVITSCRHWLLHDTTLDTGSIHADVRSVSRLLSAKNTCLQLRGAGVTENEKEHGHPVLLFGPVGFGQSLLKHFEIFNPSPVSGTL